MFYKTCKNLCTYISLDTDTKILKKEGNLRYTNWPRVFAGVLISNFIDKRNNCNCLYWIPENILKWTKILHRVFIYVLTPPHTILLISETRKLMDKSCSVTVPETGRTCRRQIKQTSLLYLLKLSVPVSINWKTYHILYRVSTNFVKKTYPFGVSRSG